MLDSTEIMKRANAAFKESTMTLEELGKRMGANPATARMTAWQFLRKGTDPRISMLLRFCAAIKMPIEDFLSEKKKSRSK
jgi:transcriptional regulator with XRE-family HTH domain